MVTINTLTCPGCGGSLEVTEQIANDGSIKCPYCGKSYIISTDGQTRIVTQIITETVKNKRPQFTWQDYDTLSKMRYRLYKFKTKIQPQGTTKQKISQVCQKIGLSLFILGLIAIVVFATIIVPIYFVTPDESKTVIPPPEPYWEQTFTVETDWESLNFTNYLNY